jgi:hypothetical protein
MHQSSPPNGHRGAELTVTAAHQIPLVGGDPIDRVEEERALIPAIGELAGQNFTTRFVAESANVSASRSAR